MVGSEVAVEVPFLWPLGTAELCQLVANSVFLLEFLYLCDTFLCGWNVAEGNVDEEGRVSLELSICWPCVCCGAPRQGVCHCEVLPRDVRDCEAVPHHPEPETLEPEGELVKAFLRAKQRFVICFNVEVEAQEVVRQAFTCPCKGQSLIFYLGVSLFCRGEGPRFIGNWLALSVVLFLQKDCTDSVR